MNKIKNISKLAEEILQNIESFEEKCLDLTLDGLTEHINEDEEYFASYVGKNKKLVEEVVYSLLNRQKISVKRLKEIEKQISKGE
jgi:hypothetical protein